MLTYLENEISKLNDEHNLLFSENFAIFHDLLNKTEQLKSEYTFHQLNFDKATMEVESLKTRLDKTLKIVNSWKGSLVVMNFLNK